MKNTKIEWTDSTWNPITGCSVVSAGCKNCYAMKLAGTRLQHHPSRTGLTIDTSNGPVWSGEVRFNREWLDQPLRWKTPRMIFVCAHGDLFHESVPDEWIDQVFAVMALAPQHTFQVLTKRARRMLEWVSAGGRAAEVFDLARNSEIAYWAGRKDEAPMSWPLPNVWLGVSVENQATADERIPLLLQTPAAWRWISAEPLLGAINLQRISLGTCDAEFFGNPSIKRAEFTLNSLVGAPKTGIPGLDWVVVGGESGPNARPMHPGWGRSLRDQCQAVCVPFFFKQWGEWEIASTENGYFDCDMSRNNAHWVHMDGKTSKPSSFREDFPHAFSAYAMVKAGKKKAGRLLDGVLHDAYPEEACKPL